MRASRAANATGIASRTSLMARGPGRHQADQQSSRVQAFTASIAATDDDELAVTYYDFRDNANPNVLLTDYWKIVSTERGRTFRESI